jgi:septum site-determining protein MinD
LRQALVKDKRFNNLQLLPAAQTKDKSALTPEQMRRVCGMLKEEFDFVIIDCPAGIEQGFQNAVAGAEKAIVVTTPEVSAVRDADRVIGLLEAGGLRDPLLLLNRIKPEMVKHNNMMSLQDVTEVLGIEVLGVVPDDESIVISTNHGEPCVMDDGSWAGQAYRNTTRRLLGEIVPLMKLQQDRGFFNRIIKFLRFGA